MLVFLLAQPVRQITSQHGNLAAVPPRKDEMRRSVDDLAAALKVTNVTLHLGLEATAPMLLEYHPDAVIVAVGATSFIPPIPGADLAHVCDAWQILTGERNAYGNVVVIGDGLVGCETAEYLVQQGSRVTIIEMLDKIATGESSTVLPTMLADFDAHDVRQYTSVTVTGIETDRVCCSSKDGSILEFPCDYVVLAAGARPVVFDTTELETAGIAITRIGDCCSQPSDISNAIRTGYDAGAAI